MLSATVAFPVMAQTPRTLMAASVIPTWTPITIRPNTKKTLMRAIVSGAI